MKDLFEEAEETDCEEGKSNSSADCEEGNSNSTVSCESLEADNDNQYEKLGQDELRALHRYSNFASDPAQIVSNIENIGDMYVERKLYDEAISYYDKALISFSNSSLNCQTIILNIYILDFIKHAHSLLVLKTLMISSLCH